MEVHNGSRETSEQVSAVIHVGNVDSLDLGGSGRGGKR